MIRLIDAAMLITLEPNGGGDVHNYIYTQMGAPQYYQAYFHEGN
jgi:hypothetical protein